MIKLLIRNGFRSLVKQMPYSFINILGLTIGVASVLIVIIWISVETRYEQFHQDKERLVRVAHIVKTPNSEYNDATINAPAGPEYKQHFPVVEQMVRLVPYKESVFYNDKFSRLNIFYSDSTFFEMFSFDLKKGDKRTCLISSQNIVLTESAALKVFGKEEPLGKTVLISGHLFTVSAVAKDPPVNTNIRFECLAPLSVIEKKNYISWDGGLTCYTYLKLVKGADQSLLEKQILVYMEDAINKKWREYGYSMRPYLQKITEIHLNSEASNEIGDKGNKVNVYIFSGIGLLILLIACFNFVNISTAISFKRAKEVSVKKIFGSDRKSVILFFISESAIAIITSLLLAFLLTKILLPIASVYFGKALTLSDLNLSTWLLVFTSLFLFCTVFASFYSSFYLSSSNPLTLLSNINKGKKKQITRNVLVSFQYTISIILIICCLVVYSQMQFVKKSDKGFNEKNILIVNLNSNTSAKYELIKNKFSSIPGVKSVSVSAGGTPGVEFTSNGYNCEGVEKPIMADAVYIDEDYFKTIGISVVNGRDFRNPKSDENKVIINQTFVKFLGWKEPLGKTIERGNIKYEVIGVVKDFNTTSFHNKIEPIFISTINEWGRFDNIIVKYQPANLLDVLKSSESIIKEIDPQAPFEYVFLTDSIYEKYASEKNLNFLYLVLSLITIFISSLGLFGLATFATQSRTKEISIRKINGATISDIFRKFNFDLLKWILISFFIGAPTGYYFMNKWLNNNFAYKITISLWLLILSGLFTMAIGFMTVSWAAGKASGTNPAETLRKE
jgi:putative ABC transport system permease protein